MRSCRSSAAALITALDAVQTFVYLVDIDEFAAMNEVYAEFFRVRPPGRITVAVSALPAGARVEITVTALAPQSS